MSKIKENNSLNGQGIETFPDGRTYEGEWKDELPNGQGFAKWPDGERYYST